jgi:hypothetical protein
MQLCMSYASMYIMQVRMYMNVMYALCMLTKLTRQMKLEVNQHRNMSNYSATLNKV